LRHVRLETQNLPSFLSLLRKDRELGKLVQHIEFHDFAESIISPTQENFQRCRTRLKKERIPTEAVDLDRLGDELPVVANKLLVGIQMLHIEDSGLFDWDKGGIKVGQTSLFKHFLALPHYARALIIQACPNLKSISTSGDEVTSPFCSRVAGRGAVPLLGLSSNLKTISFELADHAPTIKIPNLVWLLLNLSNINRASFWMLLDEAGIKFLNSYSEAWSSRKSSVKHLTILLGQQDEITTQPRSEEWLKKLLHVTQGLASFFISLVGASPTR